VPVAPPRAHCHRCHKPQLTCVCASILPVDNRTRVLVLQHPRERLHPIGTARFASLGLLNARVEVAWNAAHHEEVAPGWLPEGTALLYPAADAHDLRELPQAERPAQLLVLDGTWHTARTLYRDKKWLHALPHYRFLPAQPGRYRLRREPQADYVSTIEAIVEALSILEPETTGLDGLLAAFDAMIDRQLSLKRPAQMPSAAPRAQWSKTSRGWSWCMAKRRDRSTQPIASSSTSARSRSRAAARSSA
jgi:DTW domain-containing protein YfiP